MALYIKEYDDRWIMDPIRGAKVSGIDWHADRIDIRFGGMATLTVGYDAELAPRSLLEDNPDRHPITYWTRADLERNLASPIASPVFFKSGRVRLGFRNGWKLFSSIHDTPTTLKLGNDCIWTPSGLSTSTEYPVLQIDKWTGMAIEAPPWPGRPKDLHFDDSDDINE
ncbi:hypothetical protein [Nocardia sp. NPDC051832]|uniref:hypothetical protein n=1 Tax=Nocardia sp. NPDC051832 TaxID=3155673 RepID=UPI00341A7896